MITLQDSQKDTKSIGTKHKKLKTMYRTNKPRKSQMHNNSDYIGEMLEVKIERIMTNKEPITDTADIIYTERKDGVNPDYDIRTDRWEHAVEAMDAVSKTHKARRESRIGERAKKNMEKEAKTEIPKPGEPGKSDKPSL